jgi:hypothetical protein
VELVPIALADKPIDQSTQLGDRSLLVGHGG